MYTFRFNPVFEQWVLLGGPVMTPHEVEGAHFLDIGKSKDFGAIIHPRQPFLLDLPAPKPFHQEKGLAYASQPPVGEYELLLYKGYKEFNQWDAATWETWLKFVQIRIKQFHHNPYLHYTYLTFHTAALESIAPYQRVGDLVATSHQIAGFMGELRTELAEKLHKKEDVFHLVDDSQGRLYVPSAPMHDKELWYIPAHYRASFDQATPENLKHLSVTLEEVFLHLHDEYPHDQQVITLHTALAGGDKTTTWWLQIYKMPAAVESPLPVRPLPELFVQELRWSIGKRDL